MAKKSKKKDFTFTLPIGFLDEDGALHQEVSLRKMTGREEAVLAEPMYTNNDGKLITELLFNCITKVSKVSDVSRDMVAQMYSPDRNFLMVKLCSITFGSEFYANYTCPYCGTANGVEEDLDSLPVKESESGSDIDIEVKLEDGFEDKGKTHKTMIFRPPTGVDEVKVNEIARRNPVRGKNSLYVRCLKKFDGMHKNRSQALGTRLFEDLTLKDRRIIDNTLAEKMPGINLMREVDCVGCSRTFREGIDLQNFLYPE